MFSETTTETGFIINDFAARAEKGEVRIIKLTPETGNWVAAELVWGLGTDEAGRKVVVEKDPVMFNINEGSIDDLERVFAEREAAWAAELAARRADLVAIRTAMAKAHQDAVAAKAAESTKN